MIPFDGDFAQGYVYPFALGAYDATKPPAGYTTGTNAFEIVVNNAEPEFQGLLAAADPKHKKMLQSMLDQPRQPQLVTAATTSAAQLAATPRATTPNQHFGWVCVDSAKQRLVIAFRGSEFFHDWLDNFDFIPAPYRPIPGRGTVHQGFQFVYYAIRDNLRQVVQSRKANCKEMLITGHSLGGALCGLAVPDLLNDVAQNLSPIVYTWAEPRVGHGDYVSFFVTHVNVCYRIVNVWDVVPHLPPDLAGYEHEGDALTIDSGFTPDVAKNHLLVSGYAPGLATWNTDHPKQATRHFGLRSIGAVTGRSV